MNVAELRFRADPGKLEALVAALLTHLGMPEDHARLTARGLILADLRGHESHGVSNYIHTYYRPGLEAGTINPRPNPRIVHETATTARWDGDGGLGFVVGDIVMRDVIERARRYGSGFAAVANSRHFGMAQLYPLIAIAEGMIGFAMTNGGAAAVPFGGLEPRLGTNPISVGIPCGEEPPFVLDMATTTVAYGKILNAARDGRSIPIAWALDATGQPTSDPEAAIEGRRMLPLGATREGSAHKGYGLAVWVEAFCGVLSGAGFGEMMGSDNVGHFFGALRIDAFIPVPEFSAMMGELMRSLRATAPAPGNDRVRVAGDPEWESQQARLARGIPLHDSVVAMLEGWAAELGRPFDLTLAAG